MKTGVAVAYIDGELFDPIMDHWPQAWQTIIEREHAEEEPLIPKHESSARGTWKRSIDLKPLYTVYPFAIRFARVANWQVIWDEEDMTSDDVDQVMQKHGRLDKGFAEREEYREAPWRRKEVTLTQRAICKDKPLASPVRPPPGKPRIKKERRPEICEGDL